MSSSDHHRDLRVPLFLSALCSSPFVALATWSTVIAFTGGMLPLVEWRVSGGAALGVTWLLVVDPIVIAACWSVTALVVTRRA